MHAPSRGSFDLPPAWGLIFRVPPSRSCLQMTALKPPLIKIAHPSHRMWGTAVAGWLLAVGVVWLWMVQYGFSTDPPTSAYANTRWPAESSLQPVPDRLTLVLFLHPQCPCSRATLEELDKLLSGPGLRAEQQPDVLLLVSYPSEVPGDWQETEILGQATRLPRVQLIHDRDGVETSWFGAVSSGTVMLFDPRGNRLYAGGVTAARGHAGDNAGIDTLNALLTGQTPPTSLLPVFGCRLCSPSPGEKWQQRCCPTSPASGGTP